MKRNNIGLIAIFAVALMVLPSFSNKAKAAEAPVCSSKEKTASQLKALKVAEAEGDISTELRMKRSLLKNALVCASGEASNLKDSVQALDDSNDQVVGLKKTAISNLDDAINFYNSKTDKVSTLSLKGIQDVSKEVRDARADKYAPFMQQILNFVLWARNQKLFETADARLAQIEKSAIALKVIDNGDIHDLLKTAQDNFSEAKDLNDKASKIVLASGPAEDSFPLIQNSLNKLSATYKNFIALGDLIHGLIPDDQQGK